MNINRVVNKLTHLIYQTGQLDWVTSILTQSI